MDKSYRTTFVRRFLIGALPEPLKPANAHLQIFDNYITNTRLRLRSIRVPETKEWSYLLQQRFLVESDTDVAEKAADIYLNEAEYEQFKVFEGDEIRKNRYFHEIDGQDLTFDIHLGPLWGLNLAIAEFADGEAVNSYNPPPFAMVEISGKAFFSGSSLVTKTFADVQDEVIRIVAETKKAVNE